MTTYKDIHRQAMQINHSDRLDRNHQRNVYYEENKTTVDAEGNIIGSDNTVKSRQPVSDEYIMLYYKRILIQYLEPVGYDNMSRLLCVIADDIQFAKYDPRTDQVYEQQLLVNKDRRDYYARTLGVSVRRINQMFKKLCDANILRRKQRGTYIVNPYVIGKGNWSDIMKVRDVWTVENNQLTHQVTTEQADEDDNIRITQTTQRNDEEPTTQTIEQPSYTQKDLFGNDHNFDRNGKEIS